MRNRDHPMRKPIIVKLYRTVHYNIFSASYNIHKKNWICPYSSSIKDESITRFIYRFDRAPTV